jgi:hypothetical protein
MKQQATTAAASAQKDLFKNNSIIELNKVNISIIDNSCNTSSSGSINGSRVKYMTPKMLTEILFDYFIGKKV